MFQNITKRAIAFTYHKNKVILRTDLIYKLGVYVTAEDRYQTLYHWANYEEPYENSKKHTGCYIQTKEITNTSDNWNVMYYWKCFG